MPVVRVTEENFDQVVGNGDSVLIDFWAKWCEPCVSFSRVIESASLVNKDFLFASIDIEACPKLAEEFNIRSVPMVLILRKQVIVYAEAGALSVQALQDLLDQARSLSDEQLQSMQHDHSQSEESS